MVVNNLTGKDDVTGELMVKKTLGGGRKEGHLKWTEAEEKHVAAQLSSEKLGIQMS